MALRSSITSRVNSLVHSGSILCFHLPSPPISLYSHSEGVLLSSCEFRCKNTRMKLQRWLIAIFIPEFRNSDDHYIILACQLLWLYLSSYVQYIQFEKAAPMYTMIYDIFISTICAIVIHNLHVTILLIRIRQNLVPRNIFRCSISRLCSRRGWFIDSTSFA